MDTTRASLFAVCAPGLEPVLETELTEIGVTARAGQGGVAFEGGEAELSRASLRLRTATRVLMRLGAFRARTFAELERRTPTLPWSAVLAEGREFRLRVSCSKSRLYHQGAVAERVGHAIAATTGARPAGAASGDEDEDAEAQLVVVRCHRDVCTLSADTSGAPLHMRGYRQALAKAPLRETLAAAMLLGARWPADTPLLDPLCGSGTIAIEAALLARSIAPALANPELRPRRFRFREWPGHDEQVFEREVGRARDAVRATARIPIAGADRNAGAIRAARANAARAGVGEDVEFAVRDLKATPTPAHPGWLVTNPPYGVRIGDRDESRLVATLLARLARGPFARWTVVALTADTGLAPRLAAGEELLRTRNGGIPVRLLVRRPDAETGAAEPA